MTKKQKTGVSGCNIHVTIELTLEEAVGVAGAEGTEAQL